MPLCEAALRLQLHCDHLWALQGRGHEVLHPHRQHFPRLVPDLRVQSLGPPLWGPEAEDSLLYGSDVLRGKANQVPWVHVRFAKHAHSYSVGEGAVIAVAAVVALAAPQRTTLPVIEGPNIGGYHVEVPFHNVCQVMRWQVHIHGNLRPQSRAAQRLRKVEAELLAPVPLGMDFWVTAAGVADQAKRAVDRLHGRCKRIEGGMELLLVAIVALALLHLAGRPALDDLARVREDPAEVHHVALLLQRRDGLHQLRSVSAGVRDDHVLSRSAGLALNPLLRSRDGVLHSRPSSEPNAAVCLAIVE
mmetsp:Transcript_68943/g.190865  ORF Transcript_68943/g.190865 Transcript_68943/m.190865 type:complete len:303 (-) Transcript_68943:581-1489(-)